jgi:hypothetical protein
VCSQVLFFSDADRRGLCEDDGILIICGLSVGPVLHIWVQFNDSGKYGMTSRFTDFWDLTPCNLVPVYQVTLCSVPEDSYSGNSRFESQKRKAILADVSRGFASVPPGKRRNGTSNRSLLRPFKPLSNSSIILRFDAIYSLTTGNAVK